ncbi:attP region and P4int integrase [Escherichia coli]|nr:attP region and P4int integrase [Escherichia coli]
MTKVKSRLFTPHQPFTTYHYDIKKKKREVNSVNS